MIGRLSIDRRPAVSIASLSQLPCTVCHREAIVERHEQPSHAYGRAADKDEHEGESSNAEHQQKQLQNDGSDEARDDRGQRVGEKGNNRYTSKCRECGERGESYGVLAGVL